MTEEAVGPLALTMGEPAGIGAEIATGAWLALRCSGPPFVFVGDPRLVGTVPTRVVRTAIEALSWFQEALPILQIELPTLPEPGVPDPRNAPAVLTSISTAVAMALEGLVSGVVTSPIQKSVLTASGFAYPGHTEYLAALAPGQAPAVMMLVASGLRTVPVTIHESLRTAVERLSTELIVRIGQATAAGLQRDFAIAAPRLAVAGLNPHAGEGGTMGTEDRDIVSPAVMRLNSLGIDARGPLPADTMFTPTSRQTYDCALCMYHDQALIPVKTLDMAGGVNVTLNLGIVRTSPDHGTALDIAGRAIADPSSLIAALRLADQIARHRRRSAP